MWIEWFPWRYVVRRVARAHGFLDPFLVFSRLSRFAQPAEVVAPTELLRFGAVLHARGLMNSQAIQHNLDWIWPYWVQRQFDPSDDAFVPWAFALTHINLTHRNWTAVGLPDMTELPIVDPRGLVTPLYDGWSLDGWLLTDDGRQLIPPRMREVTQELTIDKALAVKTRAAQGALSLLSRVEVVTHNGQPTCQMQWTGQADAPAWMAIALRPFNPEGVSFVHHMRPLSSAVGWQVNGRDTVTFDVRPDRQAHSTYREGDVYRYLPGADNRSGVACDVGMATAAALFALRPNEPRELTVRVPLGGATISHGSTVSVGWEASLRGHCQLRVPDARIQFLYDAAVRTLILHAPGDVYPGPYTYKRFWFRDAAFIVHALLCVGLTERAERALDRYPARQTPFGYFRSQDGEWDANGEALWILQRFCELTGRLPKSDWREMILNGGRWIQRKRLADDRNTPHAGLLPAGFSAEHLGPNDYYYWDDFWGVAGLRAAAWLARAYDDATQAEQFHSQAEQLLACIERSLAAGEARLGRPAMPASPHRRLDAGAIGSLVGGYPLRILAADDRRLLDTAHYLLEHCFIDGGFFQDISHSGINPYLSLHVAQVLLRSGDPRSLDIVQAIAALASPTGQWPEAVHPRTRGGCMGDGQHIWASAEWLLMLRNCFVREEGEALILCSGIPPGWCQEGAPLHFGAAPTSWGTIAIRVESHPARTIISWDGAWHGNAPPIEVRLPGRPAAHPAKGTTRVEIAR